MSATTTAPMTETTGPATTFGPGRPDAAVRAIRELLQAQENVDRFGGWPPESARRRLRAAHAARACYAEYGDSFTGH